MNLAPASPNVSVVIPAKNEAANLPQLLKDLGQVITQMPNHQIEVIVVDDHSTDATAQLSRDAGAIVVANQRTPGKGNALITGFEASKGAVLVMMDADYSHRPEDLPFFLDHLKPPYGLIVGSRALGGSDEYTAVRTLGNVFLSAVFRLMTGVTTTDVLNGYKAFKREVFSKFQFHSSEFEIEIELMTNTLRLGMRVGEFPSHERERAGGEAKSRVVRHGFRFLWAILRFSTIYQLGRLRRS